MTADMGERAIPQVRVGVVTAGHPRISLQGNYDIRREGATAVYTPLDTDSRILAADVEIGIDFHWQQRMQMSLPGEVRLTTHDDGTADLLNILDVETYLTGVISSEMSADAPAEFLKAHAIISRSWLMGKLLRLHHHSPEGKVHTPTEIISWMDTGDHHGFDVCADDHCQRYQGLASVNDTVHRAVADTRGIVLADSAGEIIDARFSKCCGGRTERFSTCWQDTDYDYLTAVDDPYCDPHRLSPDRLAGILATVLVGYDRSTTDFHDWHAIVTAADIERRMSKRYGISTGRIRSISADSRGASGRIRRLRIEAEHGTFHVGKELEIRRLLSDTCLYSSWFDIRPAGDGVFLLDGHGWGHGVGLCQIGAAVMACEGHGCHDILSHYYPNTSLKKLY